LLEERGILWTTDASQKASALEDQGFSVVPMAVDGHLEGLIVLADTLRLGAKAVVQELKRLGVAEVVLITGDNAHAASLVADELGISRVFAEVLPQDKLRIVRQLQAEGRKVAFVGDGVNDGPALAAADVGIAMGVTGSDLALETASVGLLDDALERIPGIIRLSRQTLQVIRQNVVFSMSVNVLAVFLGGFGLIGPVAGALVHELSALPILANAARLIGYYDAGAKSAPGKE
jgi:Cd2+/Zn2+-exporting ATPase